MTHFTSSHKRASSGLPLAQSTTNMSSFQAIKARTLSAPATSGPSMRMCTITRNQHLPKRNERSTILSLLDELQSPKIDSDPFLNEKGFEIIQKVANTHRYKILEAVNVKTHQKVSIKVIPKSMQQTRHEMPLNAVQEATTLRHLTVDHSPILNSIPCFLELHESPTSYYLVNEFAGDLTLNEFVHMGHQHMTHKRLSSKKWKRVIKLIFWQIALNVHWLHHEMKCCHLALTPNNVMLSGELFKVNRLTGWVEIDLTKIRAKLVNFEGSKSFAKVKMDGDDPIDIAWYEDCHVAARKSDVWQLGAMLYFMATGIPALRSQNTNCDHSNQSIYELLCSHHKEECCDTKMVHLLNGMMHVRESERYDIEKVVQDKWLKTYYPCYQQLKRIKNE
eukprot:235880_1